MKRVIALAGAAKTGKSTLARILGGEEVALAAPLKAYALSLGFPSEVLYGPSDLRGHLYPGSPEDLQERFYACFNATARNLAQWSGRSLVEAQTQLHRWWGQLPARPTARQFLQSFGTECGRELYEDIWLDLCVQTVHESEADLVVIPDARYTSTFREIRANQWELWHVVRPAVSEPAFSHSSEQDVFGSELGRLRTRLIVNDGTLEELRLKALEN